MSNGGFYVPCSILGTVRDFASLREAKFQKQALPGSTIGILGGGQLGRMLALDARRMGYRTVVLDPTAGCPAAAACDKHIQAEVSDVRAARELASLSDLVTLEWELIPASVLAQVEAVKPLYPSSAVVSVIQDRLTQKEFLKKHGFPQASFTHVNDLPALKDAADKIGFPAVLKRRRQGYDGKGQIQLAGAADLDRTSETLKAPCVLEAKVDFQKELSVILARARGGEISVFPVAENAHKNGILHTTRAPAQIAGDIQGKAEGLAVAVAKTLDHVGVMSVEMFLTDGELLINEIAPRVHNSGHYTLGACATSQFEQHLRAIGGLPLGATALLTPAVMLNLMGELWAAGEPSWEKALRHPQVKLHLYGKTKPAAGRKMGHILILDANTEAALLLAEKLSAELSPSQPADLRR